MAVSAVHRTLVDTPAPILAVHLTQVDLCIFGLRRPLSGEAGKWCDFKLLARPDGRRFRLDVLERYKSFRTFVEVTILAASNLIESTRVVIQWIRIAEEARRRLGNYFGFFSIASGLMHSPYLGQWDGLWAKLEELAPFECELLNGPFKLAIEMKSDAHKEAVVTLPLYIVPYVIGWMGDSNTDKGSKIVQDLQSELLLPAVAKTSLEIECNAEAYRKNAQMAFRHINSFEDLLLDLFRTEFHIRLLWGTNGFLDYPDNFDERHAKFAKVLSALATICSRQ